LELSLFIRSKMNTPRIGESTFVADSIRQLVKTLPARHLESPEALGDAILYLLDSVDIADKSNITDQYYDWVESVGSAWCKLTRRHYWVYDHCGFWGHQYCLYTGIRKYPEIPSRCSECGELMKITEDEYKTQPVE